MELRFFLSKVPFLRENVVISYILVKEFFKYSIGFVFDCLSGFIRFGITLKEDFSKKPAKKSLV